MGTRFNPGVLAHFYLAVIVVCMFGFYLSWRRKNIPFSIPKKYSIKIKVDLDHCELITSNFLKSGINFSEITPYGTYIDRQALTSVSQTASKAIYIRFQKGDVVYFAGPIYKDEISIRVLFIQKKETEIYVDQTSGKYLFDLNFLFN